MPNWEIQTNFSAGVLDPKLKGRIGLDLYYNGSEIAENVIALPQGGFTRRPGFEYLNTLANNSRLFAFEFNVDQSYVIAFDTTDWYAYDLDGVQIDTDTHTFGADIFEADFVQSADVLILVHPDHAPAELRRNTASDFSFADITLLNIPQFNFNDASSPAPTSCEQTLTFTSFNTSDRYRLVLNEFLSEEISFAAVAADNASRIQKALLDLANVNSDPSTVTVTPNSLTSYDVVFSGNSADAFEELNGLIVESANIGARVTAVVDVAGVSKKEDVWSVTRGYPVSVIFHEGRLVFGGSKSRPATLWLSFVNDFFNFKLGTGLDDEAIEATLDTDQLNGIVGLSTNRNLQIFTTGQEFFVPNSPITPGNIVIKPQSQYGAKAIKPQVIDGFTCYVQRTGAALRRFILTEFESSYESISVSFLAPALVNNPAAMTVQRGVFNIDAPYLYLLNEDGTLGVYSSKKEEGINNWVKWTTNGTINSIVAVQDELFISVTREINSSSVVFLERLYKEPDKQMWCDAGFRYDQAASASVSGLGHLNGKSVRVVADNNVQEDKTPSGGTITLDRDTEFGWVGLDYNPLIQTMPVIVPTQQGVNFPLRKRFVRIRPLLLDSLGVYLSDGVDEIFIPDRQFDVDDLDSSLVPDSGIGQGVRFLGWTYEAQLQVFQKDPLPMTITSLSMELG